MEEESVKSENRRLRRYNRDQMYLSIQIASNCNKAFEGFSCSNRYSGSLRFAWMGRPHKGSSHNCLPKV